MTDFRQKFFHKVWETRLKRFNVADRLKGKIYEQQNSCEVENVDSYGKTTRDTCILTTGYGIA